MPAPVSRRTALFGLAAASLLPAGIGPALAAGAPIRSVVVDTRPLAARGVPRYAALTRDVALPIAQRVFAGRIGAGDRSAPTLVIEISSIRLVAYAGGGSRRSRDMDSDYIVGAGLLVGADGKVLARYPITATRDPADGGPWFQYEESERRRLINLCESLVHWISREF
jgi:hypothetical protein